MNSHVYIIFKGKKVMNKIMLFLYLFPYSQETFICSWKPKGRISKRVFQENKARQIFWKTNISYPLTRTRTCAYQGVRNVRFSENLACFVFLKHSFGDSLFCLIADDLFIKALKKFCNMFEANNKNTRVTSLTSF